jgi:high-affinity iron transporter
MRRAKAVIGLAVMVMLGPGLVRARGEVSAGTDVSGVVRMPDVCSPSISPAVVYLTPADATQRHDLIKRLRQSAASVQSNPAPVVLINQRGLQFVPRVRAIALGQAVRFTNEDGETHNVHVVSPGFTFNQSMSPGQFHDFTPDKPGVMKLACDIHQHMRGFVVVSSSPWAMVCDREGRYRLKDVPDGRYRLTAWHEMGDPVEAEISVTGGTALNVPELTLTSSVGPSQLAGPGQSALPSAPVRRWPDVIDRIGVRLAASREALARTGELAKALKLAEDAYWEEFEASDFETAVRKYLGYAQARELERQFHAIRVAVREVGEERRPVEALGELSHKLLSSLLAASRDLDAKGVTDRLHVDMPGGQNGAPVDLTELNGSGSTGDPKAMVAAVTRGFHRVAQHAEHDGPDVAASELTTVYMTEFEPLERYLLGRSPQVVRPLEIKFNLLRGDLASGLKGERLASRLEAISSEVETLVGQLETRPVGAFGPAFVASLVTIVREGVEVILVVAMLLALVAKVSTASVTPTGNDQVSQSRSEPDQAAAVNLLQTAQRGSRAIWWGVGLAAVASVATAIVLNALVVSAKGAAREILEGVVMLAASAVLFYVSYWLISQLESKRWIDFIKRQARHGLELGGQGTLALTAFLAVYREGAETSLMYQALIGSEGRTQAGFFGLTVGLAVGIVILGVIALVIRATSVRLPLHVFFKFSGIFLYGLAIVFAGNGIFELQNAGVLLTTNVSWLGRGLPWIGLYPNLQVISVQGLLLAGAILGWVAIPRVSLPASAKGGAAAGLVAKRS